MGLFNRKPKVENERDTHFQGFAKLLYDEIRTLDQRAAKKLIAQRTYDLMYLTRQETAYGMDLLNISNWIAEDVPDITEWPE